MNKILLVDDEESIRNMMRMTLELDGYSVLTAADGPSALTIFQEELPDVVLLDVRMPGMDGVEALRRIKEINRDAEVIIISGHGDMDMAITIRTMLVDGQTAYLQSGGGLVADSVPATEYQECVNKARALVTAIEIAEAGLE